MAMSLIDDLEVQCINYECPWTGSLERFKAQHQHECKLKEGGLCQWLKDMSEGASKIKENRKQRIHER